MQYNITGKHLDISQAMRDYVEEKLARIEGHHDKITSAQITLKTDSHQKVAEGTLHVTSGKTFHGDAAHDDMYAAIDLLADKLDKQVRRHKRKITDHRE